TAMMDIVSSIRQISVREMQAGVGKLLYNTAPYAHFCFSVSFSLDVNGRNVGMACARLLPYFSNEGNPFQDLVDQLISFCIQRMSQSFRFALSAVVKQGNTSPGPVGNHDACALFAITELLPKFLRNKRHERMQRFENTLEECSSVGMRRRVDGLAILRLDHLQIPRAEVFP